MKKIFHTLLLVAAIGYTVVSCSPGAYQSNPSSNANGSINPLHPLKAGDFTWSGTAKVSLNVNGTSFSTDSVIFGYIDSIQTNAIVAFFDGGKKALYMNIQYGWANQIYNMGYKQYNNQAYWLDSVGSATGSYLSALGNSGELFMTANDTLNFDGKFYFQGVNSSSQVFNISNGVFNLKKY